MHPCVTYKTQFYIPNINSQVWILHYTRYTIFYMIYYNEYYTTQDMLSSTWSITMCTIYIQLNYLLLFINYYSMYIVLVHEMMTKWWLSPIHQMTFWVRWAKNNGLLSIHPITKQNKFTAIYICMHQYIFFCFYIQEKPILYRC